MADNFKAIIYPVKDLEKAKALFTTLLGAQPDQDAPYYVGWTIDGQNIGLNPHGFDQGMTGPVPYVDVADLEARIDALTAAGASVRQQPTDVGGGLRIATVEDADGNIIGLRG
ncbi:VOC family protein [Kitasatospora viridis]|uniref:Putative enzyme related to lactoylglutathione lyase n=1 Tax=Kitasatospora viridis TaxID=281105 RepID=A0A561TTP5_9ACTN|nr:VOC family protein [Kitasatospora viridis]TWF90468.1 putative enzyme related to lactoylglutathione lyase [Kitasatospora viridis]